MSSVIHHDLFDRLLIAQSIAEPLTLLTNDAVLDRYRVGARVVADAANEPPLFNRINKTKSRNDRHRRRATTDRMAHDLTAPAEHP